LGEEMKSLLGFLAVILMIGSGTIIAWVIVDFILQIMAGWEVRNVEKIEFY
jgi:hypothetical protein